jgi:hypothetical protein
MTAFVTDGAGASGYDLNSNGNGKVTMNSYRWRPAVVELANAAERRQPTLDPN